MTISISIAKETRHDEKRIALLPREVKKLSDLNINVSVEEDAGIGIGILDDDYLKAGAKIVSKDEIWSNSKYIAKLLCPTTDEVSAISPETHVSAFFYPGEHYRLIQHMMRKHVCAYSYEYFEEDDGTYPMMSADGWLSGRLAVQNAAFYLQTQFGGRGVVLGGPNGDENGRVLVIGSGNVGSAAIGTALALGAQVTVACRSSAGLGRCAKKWPTVNCILANDQKFKEAVTGADIVIGAMLISTYDTPALITENLVKAMRPGSIVVDVTCGYGVGYMPTADKITMPGVGPYVRHGVLHIKNPRLPAMTPLSAAQNASKLYEPYILGLASSIFLPSQTHPVSERGCIIRGGNIINQHVKTDFRMIESDNYRNYELLDHLHHGQA